MIARLHRKNVIVTLERHNPVAFGHVAQWIEHQIPVLGVGGSNPSMLVSLKANLAGFLGVVGSGWVAVATRSAGGTITWAVVLSADKERWRLRPIFRGALMIGLIGGRR